MKLLLHKFREPQRDWYGKNGVSVHDSMFFFRSDDSADIQVEIHDVFSNGDSTQNFFLQQMRLNQPSTTFLPQTKTYVHWLYGLITDHIITPH